MTKRLVLAVYDVASALVLACLLVGASATPAYAYIDPSVMTYTIQAVAGVAVALSTVAGVAARRGRKRLMHILDIDENARREIEPDVQRVGATARPVVVAPRSLSRESVAIHAGESDMRMNGNPAGLSGVQRAEALRAPSAHDRAVPDAPAVQELGSEEPSGFRAYPQGVPSAGGHSRHAGEETASHDRPAPNKRGRKSYRPTWKERLVYGAIVAFFFTFTIYYVAPLEIVAGSSSSLIFSLSDVWWVPVLPGLGIVAGITLVLALLRGRAFSIGLLAVAAVGLCAYVQALCLNSGLPAADGATIVWANYMDMQVISSIVWAAIIVGALVFAIVRSRRAQGIAAIVSVFLVLVQGVGLASLAIAPASDTAVPEGGKVVMTEDQLFTVNPKHNVIVFILDTYDTAYLRRVLGMNPHLLDGLTGFTNYENATSAMIPTRFAIPEMLTGQMPDFDEEFSTYKAQRYARSSFLSDIHDANYSIGLYTDSMTISRLSQAEQYGITSKTVNIHDLPNSMMNYAGTLYSLYQMGQYRDVLWPFKWAFWYYTDQINQAMTLYHEDSPPDETVYVIDDVRYYNRLCKLGLSMEEGEYDGAYRFIHLLGSHYPFSYDENVVDLGEDNSDVFKQSQGAIKIVQTYIDELKRLGVYENTTIIITADHGYWTITLDPIQETSTPIMFVKPEQSAAADAEPIKVDEKPVSHLDLQATVLDAMGLDYSEYSKRVEWAGYSMFDDIDPDRKRYYLTTDSEPDLTEVQFREYLIDGNALDWGNWSETGRTIDAQK